MNVAGEETVERGLRAPLELQQFPGGLEIQGEPPSTVDVRVRGTSGALSRVGAGDIVGVLDLHARGRQPVVSHDADQIRVPTGIEVVQVTPSTIALTFENSLARDVPVIPRLRARPRPAMSSWESHRVAGTSRDCRARNIGEARDEAVTETVSIPTRTTRFARTCPWADRSALRLKTQRTVTVSVSIAPARSSGACTAADPSSKPRRTAVRPGDAVAVSAGSAEARKPRTNEC